MLCHLGTYLVVLSYWGDGTLVIMFELLALSADCEVGVLTPGLIAVFLFSLPEPALTTIFAPVQKSLRHFDILGDQVIYAFIGRALILIAWDIVQRLCNGFPAAGTFYSHNLFAPEGVISQRLHVALELLVSDRLQ